METNKIQTEKKSSSSVMIVVVVLLVIGLLLAMTLSRKGGTGMTGQNNQTQKAKTEGSFNLSASSMSVKVGQPVTLTLTADSYGKDVVGFDAVVQYDQDLLTAGKSETPLKGFTAYQNINDGVLAATVVKNPLEKGTNVFANTQVLTLTFTPKKAGTASIAIVPSAGRATTKYVDSKTIIGHPAVNTLTLTIAP